MLLEEFVFNITAIISHTRTVVRKNFTNFVILQMFLGGIFHE